MPDLLGALQISQRLIVRSTRSGEHIGRGIRSPLGMRPKDLTVVGADLTASVLFPDVRVPREGGSHGQS